MVARNGVHKEVEEPVTCTGRDGRFLGSGGDGGGDGLFV